ncbi:hypothetical protein, partial [uncultured Gammaproteobacteria bacterium]
GGIAGRKNLLFTKKFGKYKTQYNSVYSVYSVFNIFLRSYKMAKLVLF